MNRLLTLLRALAALVLALFAGPALAAITVNAITINGGSSANVAPGSYITMTVTVTLTAGSRWRATGFSTTPASSLGGCALGPDIRGNGTYTRTFTGYAPSQTGVFSINVVAWTNTRCRGTASQTRTLPNAINTGPATLTLNHVRIVHDGAASVCAPETVSLRACANAACTTLYTANVNVTLGNVGTWSANPVAFSGGSANLTLANSNAGTVNLSGTVTSPSATTSAAQCYRGATAGACGLVFSNGSCSLDAVETGRGGNTPIFTKRIGASFSLDVLALNNGAVNPSSTASVTATVVSASGSGCSTTALAAPVLFTFTSANAGRRTVTFTPTVASRDARIRLTSGSIVQCSSDNFAVRPSFFTVSSISANADSTGASVSASPALKAGSGTFSLVASATSGYDGIALVNSAMVDSAQAATGELSSDVEPMTVAGPLTYSEVGYFRLQPFGVYDDGSFASVDAEKPVAECFEDTNLGSDTAPADPNVIDGTGKLGCYFGNTLTPYFGRFIPDHFSLVDASIVNRSSIPACAASTFSYLGEALTPTFTLTARNAEDDVTANYTGSFARLNIATSLGLAVINDPPAGTRTPFPVCGATPAHPCFTPGTVTGSFVDGEAVAIAAPITALRSSTRVGPFEHVKVGLAPIDLDGVRISDYDLDATSVTAGTPNRALVASTPLRYGRLNVDNAYGSELLNLSLKANAQYWNGTGYVNNTDDSCTPMATSSFVLESYVSGITATNMKMTQVVSGGPLQQGVGKLVLGKPAPTPATRGSVVLKSQYPYLPGSGRATFGAYKSGPVIHVRESY